MGVRSHLEGGFDINLKAGFISLIRRVPYLESGFKPTCNTYLMFLGMWVRSHLEGGYIYLALKPNLISLKKAGSIPLEGRFTLPWKSCSILFGRRGRSYLEGVFDLAGTCDGEGRIQTHLQCRIDLNRNVCSILLGRSVLPPSEAEFDLT